MKRFLLSLPFVFLLCGIVYAESAQYRKHSGEVYGISATHTFSASEFLGVIENATYPDGTTCIDPNGELRVLGYAKILDGTIIRNATQQEIDTFAQLAVDDSRQRQADMAILHFKTHPQFRRIMTAFAAILVDEINILRSEHGLPDRTLQQLKTTIENRISKDD